MAKQYNILTFDFETTTNNAEVYSWAIAERKEYNDYKIVDGISIDSFMDTIFTLDKDYYMYAHNGAKFDNQFILPWLYENGFNQVIFDHGETVDDSDLDLNEEFGNIIVESKRRHLKYGEYSMITDDSFKIMELRIALPSTKRNKSGETNRVLVIRDSNLMFTSSLADYGKSLNAQHDTDIWTKHDLDGGYNRTELYKSYEEFIADGNEQEYLHQDVKILNEFIHMMIEVLPFKKWKMTAAGTAYRIWKYDYFGQSLIERKIRRKEIIAVQGKDSSFTRYKLKSNNKVYNSNQIIDWEFEQLFPLNWMKDSNIDGIMSNRTVVNMAYQGGLTMANPEHAGKLMQNILYADINSSYPTQMMNGFMPWGSPITNEEELEFGMKSLWAIDIEEVENKKGLPFVFSKNNDNLSKIYSKKISDQEVYMTDEELERFETYYEGEYSKTFLVAFNSVPAENIFGTYIKYFYNLKANAKSPAEKLYAKLMLNALYGKFGQDIERSSRIFVDGSWRQLSILSEPQYYLPLAVWITAYARMYMVDAVGEKFENVVYLDTDSLSIKVPEEAIQSYEKAKEYLEDNYDMEVDPDCLGGWDIEYYIKAMVARRAKQYYFVDTNNIPHIKFAGLRISAWEDQNKYKKEDLPENLNEDINKINFGNFVTGIEGFSQLRPKRMKTGLILEQYDKNINHLINYATNESSWFKSEEDLNKQAEENIKLWKTIQ